ncbi:MAG: acyl-ACP--UDP-N-acetylglucosamine O-acyltransferase [bacterium]
MIHPTAIVDKGAQLHPSVEIGAFTIIGKDVKIGENSKIDSHCVINGPTDIGCDNHIYPFNSIGLDPQDKKFHGENSKLSIGNNNTIRENCTINRGTKDGNNLTFIGDNNWIMAYVHIAHDCVVGNDCIFANASSLAGHVVVQNNVILGGFTLIHQFCRIGSHAFTSMGSAINRDVPTFVTVSGRMAVPKGINSEGLRRRKFSEEDIRLIRKAYRTLYKSGLRLEVALEELKEMAKRAPVLTQLVEFISSSQRSIVR